MQVTELKPLKRSLKTNNPPNKKGHNRKNLVAINTSTPQTNMDNSWENPPFYFDLAKW